MNVIQVKGATKTVGLSMSRCLSSTEKEIQSRSLNTSKALTPLKTQNAKNQLLKVLYPHVNTFNLAATIRNNSQNVFIF